MPVGRALSAMCDPALHWKDPLAMHESCRRNGGRFLHHKSGEGAGRQNFRARCTCSCHTLTRAVIPALNPPPTAAERQPAE